MCLPLISSIINNDQPTNKNDENCTCIKRRKLDYIKTIISKSIHNLFFLQSSKKRKRK